MTELTPQEIVERLDKHIVGQQEAKRAIAVAIRNRWRRQRVDESMRDEIGPKNVMMIGPTGVGKTEIARRLAALTGAPFVKVDATKYTEVGYHGSDVETMARELIENALSMVRDEERKANEEKATEAARRRLVDALVEKYVADDQTLEEYADPSDETIVESEAETAAESASDAVDSTAAPPFKLPDFEKIASAANKIRVDPTKPGWIDDISKALEELVNAPASEKDDKKTTEPDAVIVAKPEEKSEKAKLEKARRLKAKRLRPRVERALERGKLENETLEVDRRAAPSNIRILASDPEEFMSPDVLSELFHPRRRRPNDRKTTVAEARRVFFEDELDKLLDEEKIRERAVKLAENLGVIFIDEIDKIVGSDTTQADVSRMGVQRDLLPIVEGTTIRTRYGLFSTSQVLFIAAGAFHRVKPSDLTPELQGRFPIRVELAGLKKEDFIRILTEPKNALTRQYRALMKTENIDLVFEPDAIEAIAEYAEQANLATQNIGARRLYTIMERLLEDLNFEAANMKLGRVVINAAYVKEKIDPIVNNEDLSKFIL